MSGTLIRAVLTAVSKSSFQWISAAWVPESATRVPTAITTADSPMIPKTWGLRRRAVTTVNAKVTA